MPTYRIEIRHSTGEQSILFGDSINIEEEGIDVTGPGFNYHINFLNVRSYFITPEPSN